ncbi:CaiB/BaiF CoA transferase family protein [Pontivivens insulae]|uniref:Acetyl-CoA:oxalate CoA-transferase n=1 Tax=Pontivivens insulae TaxID=1639689 RepID=A0A2R8ACT7_9RHOB|nr:CaiB/BaiF CoA-transferase family protein [Pontivivens insulae]RED13970.1 formyl-CoA transferase [Pontivivens insulae]SPF30044.1 Acetyl-CoA:oxalate CoA-transferase [Pontivivens insulae]
MAIEGPLKGVRVLDLTNVLSGPYCCYQLGLMGAEIIKVERPGTGDLARNLGADPARNAAGMGISFLAQNAGKSSVTLDLKQEAGRDIFLSLLSTADVVVENFRPGVMERLDLGYDVLKASRPEIIQCAISGFGQTGPLRGDPAYDQIVQGLSGVMSVTGDADSAPLRVGYPVADTVAGMVGAFAIAAALNARPRGAFIDVSMMEAMLSTMGWVVSNHLIGGTDPQANGNENPTSAPSGTFQAQDGPLNISANRDEQWQALARHLGRTDLLENPDYATREDRKRNRIALRAELEKTLRQRPAADWVRSLNDLGVPSGAVWTVPQALESAQIVERGLIAERDGVPLTASPIIMNGARPQPDRAPPSLGAHNETVFSELGLTAEQIEGLRKSGVI